MELTKVIFYHYLVLIIISFSQINLFTDALNLCNITIDASKGSSCHILIPEYKRITHYHMETSHGTCIPDNPVMESWRSFTYIGGIWYTCELIHPY